LAKALIQGYLGEMSDTVTEKASSHKRILFVIFASAMPLWAAMAAIVYVLWYPVACFSDKPGIKAATCAKALESVAAKGVMRKIIVDRYIARLKEEETSDAAITFLKAEIAGGHDTEINEETLANLYGGQDDHRLAAETFLKAADLNPKNLEHFRSAMSSYNLAEEYEVPLAKLEPFLATHPREDFALDWKGWFKSRLGKHDEAILAYSEAIKLKPDDATYYRDRGDSYEATDKFELAEQDFSRAIEKDGTDFNFRRRAQFYRNRNRFAEAIADLKQAVRISPDEYYQTEIIDVSLEADNLNEAQAQMQALEALRPTEFTTWDYAYRLAVKRKDWSEAERAISKLAALPDGKVDAIEFSARLSEEKGDWLRAVQQYKLLLQQQPDRTALYANIGDNLIDAGIPAASLSWFDKEVAADPDKSYSYSDRARAFTHLKLWDKAIADANTAIEFDDRNAMAFARRAEALSAQSKTEAALRDYAQSLELDASNDWVRKDYADLLQKIGDTSAAAKIRAIAPK
jgi:tetratricopeptide (TPR) repeat protein